MKYQARGTAIKNAIEISMEQYAMANAIVPGSTLKQQIADAIIFPAANPAKVEPAKVVGVAPSWKYAAAASVILLLGSVLLNLNYQNRLEKSTAALTETKQELIAANDKLNGMNADMSVIQNKYSKAVSLEGLPAAPDAAAKIFWMKNTGEVYIDPSNLPEAPAGKQYQLWGIVDGKPVDGGMIHLKSGETYQILKMKSFGKADAFAITLEKEGGSPTPDLTQLYVMGKI
jgi:hypothetical protein